MTRAQAVMNRKSTANAAVGPEVSVTGSGETLRGFLRRKGSYETRDELEFIFRLSDEKLERYAGALHRRQDWGEIDREAVLRRVRERLLRIPVLGKQ